MEQAWALLFLDPKRPKQANVRRSISAAYYALFHLLTENTARRMVRTKGRHVHQDLVRRAHEHGKMKTVANQFKTGQALQRAGLPANPILARLAGDFAFLQEERHTADYDLAISVTRVRALQAFARSSAAQHDWQSVRGTPEADYFLLALLLGMPRS